MLASLFHNTYFHNHNTYRTPLVAASVLCILYFSPLTQLPINVDLLVGGPANIQNEKIVSARVLRAFYRLKNQEEFDSGKGLFVSKFKGFIHVFLHVFFNCTSGTKLCKVSHIITCVIYISWKVLERLLFFITNIQLLSSFDHLKPFEIAK